MLINNSGDRQLSEKTVLFSPAVASFYTSVVANVRIADSSCLHQQYQPFKHLLESTKMILLNKSLSKPFWSAISTIFCD
jgi:hypothetical protein